MLDLVYEAKRAGAVEQDGHNVMLYRDVDGGVAVEVGFQAQPFAATGEVVPSELPAGTVVAATARNYGELDGAHRSVNEWCREQGHVLEGTRWEIYGDPDPDPHGDVAVEVVYLLS